MSDSFSVSNGVRQGSVLSPVYLLYIWMDCYLSWRAVVLAVVCASVCVSVSQRT